MGGGICRGLNLGYGLNDGDNSLRRIELGADARFGLGDGFQSRAGDGFINVGVALGSGPLVSLFTGHPNRMLQPDGKVLLPIFQFLLSFIPLNFVAQLHGQGSATFLFFGFEEFCRWGDLSEIIVKDDLLDGCRFFGVAGGGMLASP